jgi:hypothetical protein
MLIHIFNEDDTISILIDSKVIVIKETHQNYDEIVQNLKLRNWDLVVELIKD